MLKKLIFGAVGLVGVAKAIDCDSLKSQVNAPALNCAGLMSNSKFAAVIQVMSSCQTNLLSDSMIQGLIEDMRPITNEKLLNALEMYCDIISDQLNNSCGQGIGCAGGIGGDQGDDFDDLFN